MDKILVTGAFGQVGSELTPALRKKFGKDSVIAMGFSHADSCDGPVITGDARDKVFMEKAIKENGITTIYHLAGMVSAASEEKPDLGWDVNINTLKIVLDLARDHKLKVFWPSSIAAFGPTTPMNNTPQRTILEPTTIYGIAKVAGELLCQYYHNRWGVDVRSLRYPGIISWKAEPGGGTTDYAVAIFYDGLKKGSYECFVGKDTVLPMMFMDDAIEGTIKLMDADPEKLTVWTSYNFAAISFSAEKLAKEVGRLIPGFTITYKPDFRQKIADSWPKGIDDSLARKDWGWKYSFDLAKMCKAMVDGLKIKLGESHGKG